MDAPKVIDPFKRLLHEISKKLSEKDFRSLKYFAYEIPSSEIEECEKKGNPCFQLFDKLQSRDIISEDKLSWLHVVLREMDLDPVLKLIHEYEINKCLSLYKIMLHRVARDINENVLDELKTLSQKIDRSSLDDIKTPLDFFDALEKHGVINEHDVRFLFDILDQVGQKRLAKEVTDYINQQSNKNIDIEHCHQGRQPAELGYHEIKNTTQRSQTVPQQISSALGQSLGSCIQEQHTTTMGDKQGTHPLTSAETGLVSSNARPEVPKFESLLSMEDTGSFRHLDIQQKPRRVSAVQPLQKHPEMLKTSDENQLGHTEPKTRYTEAAEVNNNHRELLPSNSDMMFNSTEVKQLYTDGSSGGSKCTDDASIVQQMASSQDDKLENVNSPIPGQHQQQLSTLSNTQDAAGGLQVMQTKQYLSQLHTDSPFKCIPSSSSGLENCQLQQTQSVSRNAEPNINMMALAQQQCKPPVTLLNYQRELAADALDGRNSVICAPARSGKLLTATYVFYVKHQEALNEGRSFKALFVVHHHRTIYDVEEKIRKLFEDEENKRGIVAFTNEVNKLGNLLQHHDVIVLPAEVLANALASKVFDLGRIQLLILDECHHLQIGQPHDRIMQAYSKLKLENRLKPQVIGLIAPVAVQETGGCSIICDKFNCSRIVHVCHKMDQLLQDNPYPKQDQIINMSPRDKDDLFVLTTTYLMTETEKLTPEIGVPDTKVISQRGSQSYEDWLVAMQKDPDRMDFKCKTLLVYNKALMYCDELSRADVLPLMGQHFTKYQALQPSGIEDTVLQLYNSQVQDLQEMAEEETLEDNFKLQKLSHLLVELLVDGVTSKGVLFTKMAYSAERLVQYFRRHDLLKDIVKCALFSDTEEHHDTLEQFRLASINLLVTTESCANVPRCDFLICYNIQETKFWSTHSYAAKKRNCYVIGTVNVEREYANLSKEHKLLKELCQMDKKEKYH